MGYTHYFPQSRDLTFDEMRDIGAAARKIIELSNVRIVREYDLEEPAEITGDAIAFNGKGEAGHETFWLQKTRYPGFLFCKTANKPYDIVVVALLTYVHARVPDAFEISSDGDGEDWAAGVDLARKALDMPLLKCPLRRCS